MQTDSGGTGTLSIYLSIYAAVTEKEAGKKKVLKAIVVNRAEQLRFGSEKLVAPIHVFV